MPAVTDFKALQLSPLIENSCLPCLKLVKICEFYEISKIRKNLFYWLTSKLQSFWIRTTAKSRLHWGYCWMGTVGSDDQGLRFWHRGRQWSCRRFV